MSNNQDAKKRLETGLVTQFLNRIGYNGVLPVSGERPDFIVELDNRRIGIEETKLHPDAAGKKGSQLRAEEEMDARSGAKKGYWINPNFRPALNACILEKISTAKSYDPSKYDALWLLITSNIPKMGAAASTTVSSSMVNVDELNALYGELLTASPFEAVYWYLMLDQQQTIFTWSRQGDKWGKNTLPPPSGHYWDNFTADELKNLLKDREWLKDPIAKGEAVAREVMEEFSNQKKVEQYMSVMENKYAGFFRRLAAGIIDLIFLGTTCFLVGSYYPYQSDPNTGRF